MAEYAQKPSDSPRTVETSPRAASRRASSPSLQTDLPAFELDSNRAALNQSPRVRAIAQLQQMINGSARVARIAQLSARMRRLPDDATAQLKALSTKTLNVVGEDHGEAKLPDRRSIERQIAAQEADGAYWLEQEFKARDFGRLKKLFTRTDPRAAADPLALRANYGSVFARNAADRLLRYAQQSPADINESVSSKASSIETLNGSCQAILAGFLHLIRLSEASEQPEELQRLSDPEKAALRALVDFARDNQNAVLALARGLKQHTDLLPIYQDLVKNLELLTQVKDTMELNGPILLQGPKGRWAKEFDAENSRKELTGSGPSRFLRSMEMGAAAHARHKTKGIWKVGENHIEDLANAKVPGEYNVLTRQEFNDEYAGKYKLPLKTG